MFTLSSALLLFCAAIPAAQAHLALFHPSMYGMNVTGGPLPGFPEGNRPVDPLMYRHFNQWWFHGHMNHPPHKKDVFNFKAGSHAKVEIACHIGATSYYKLGGGGFFGTDSVCPNQPSIQWHEEGPNVASGSALAVVDQENPTKIKPKDFVVFSINATSPWYRNTYFQVPANMPKCTGRVCHCAWLWVHKPNGAAQMYMTPFQCNFTNTKPNAPKLAAPKVAKVCGADPIRKIKASPKNCTVGAKQPLYWLQLEGNNIIADYMDPPTYSPKYGFHNGAQNDIFVTTHKRDEVETVQARESTIDAARNATVAEPASMVETRSVDAVTLKDKRMSGLQKHHRRRAATSGL